MDVKDAQKMFDSGLAVEVEEIKEKSAIEASMLTNLYKGVKMKKRLQFFDGLAPIIQGGYPLIPAMYILVRSISDKATRMILMRAIHDLGNGESITKSLSKTKGFINDTASALIYAGEETGTIGDSMQSVKELYQRGIETRREILGTLTYPFIVFIAACGLLYFFSSYLIPQISKAYSSFGGELPWITIKVVGVADFVKANPWALFVPMLTPILLFIFNDKLDKKFLWYSRLMLNIPLIGPMIRTRATLDSLRTYSKLQAAGLKTNISLPISGKASNNHFIESVFRSINQMVLNGYSLTEAFGHYADLFGKLGDPLIGYIEAGEESGDISKQLNSFVDLAQKEMEFRIKTMKTFLTPLITLALAGLVGTVIIAVFYPIFTFGEVMLDSTD